MYKGMALGTVSRACKYSDIPIGLKNVASKFFFALGAPAYVLDLPNATAASQKNFFINESLTTDYGRVRYYLFANSTHYQQLVNGRWELVRNVKSTWTSEEISDAMKADLDFAPYYLNRGRLFSARAGLPSIVEDRTTKGKVIKVIGSHQYFDPASKAVVVLPNTSATDCNITNIGFGLFDR